MILMPLKRISNPKGLPLKKTRNGNTLAFCKIQNCKFVLNLENIEQGIMVLPLQSAIAVSPFNLQPSNPISNLL